MHGGYRAGLNDVELPILFGPLYILGELIPVLYPLGYAGEVGYLVVAYLLLCLLGGGEGHLYIGVFMPGVTVLHQLPGLLADVAVGYLQVILVDDVQVRGYAAGDDGFTEPVAGFDGYLGGIAGHRLQGEHYPGSLGLHHSLHRDGDAHLEVVEALLLPVEEGSGFEQGCPAPMHRVHHLLLALHVEVGVLLAGERRIGQVLGGGR